MLSLLFRFELKKFASYFKKKTLAKSIVTLLFLFVFGFVGFGVYFFFVSGLRYITVEAVEDVRSALTLFIYESFFVVLGGIVAFSSLLSCIFTLFKGGNNTWILSTPSYRLFPKWTLVKSFMSSFLVSFVIFLPAVLAFNRIFHFGVLGFFLILFSVLLTLVSINTVSFLLVLFISYGWYTLSNTLKSIPFRISSLLSLVTTIFLVVAYFAWRAVHDVDLVKLFRADEFDGGALSITTIGDHFKFLPTHPLSLLILYFQNGELTMALTQFAYIIFISGILLVAWNYSSVLFYRPWKKLQEGSSNSLLKKSGTYDRQLITFSGNITQVLFKKEAVLTMRNMKGVLWFLFLMVLWFAQIAINSIMSKNIARYQLDITEKAGILQALQFIIAVYFMAAFALRFVFPTFSAERKNRWVLASAPVQFKKLFFGKYFFYSIFFLVLGIIMSTTSAFVLHLPLVHAVYLLLLFLSTTIFIVTLALVLGAMFPSLESDDPEVVSTSMPGLFFTAAALLYGGVSDWTLFLLATKGYVVPVLAFFMLTCILSFVMVTVTPYILSRRNMKSS
jgi:hypothetical protein